MFPLLSIEPWTTLKCTYYIMFTYKCFYLCFIELSELFEKNIVFILVLF